jgi:hypothetical protein
MAGITEIKTNLTRISKAKNDIISAITAKGGTVASGAKIEDLPACIRAIPTGGGGKAASLKIGDSPEFGKIIIHPGGTKTMEKDMENIDCKVGDLIGVISQVPVTIEMGCVLTYQSSLFEKTSTGAMRTIEVYYFTITASEAAINVINPLG